jgi:hypothetical protein
MSPRNRRGVATTLLGERRREPGRATQQADKNIVLRYGSGLAEACAAVQAVTVLILKLIQM